jgi:uncharacterized repeat protein (TIGR03803 family)
VPGKCDYPLRPHSRNVGFAYGQVDDVVEGILKAGNMFPHASGFCPADRLRRNLAFCFLLFALCTTAESAQAGTVLALHVFRGGSDGAEPGGTLMFDRAGNIYGTTTLGGETPNCSSAAGDSCGTIFKISSGGAYKILYTLCALPNCSDGAVPSAALIEDKQGNLYGTTEYGGSTKCAFGCGVVFRVSPGGVETVVHAFLGPPNDGSNPVSTLRADRVGDLYGTTEDGGTNNAGTLFKIAPDGREKILHVFGSASDGGNPGAGVVVDTEGNLYGTTEFGGTYGGGAVYKLAHGGTESVLYSFTGGSDGGDPSGSLVADQSGNLYGTTNYGGGSSTPWCRYGGCGTVFKIAPGGAETTIYTFQGGLDGSGPAAAMFLGRNGDLYGTTVAGGNTTNSGNGTIFQLKTNGDERVLYRFCTIKQQEQGCPEGAGPFGGLIRDGTGNLYGTTSLGGGNPASIGAGTVFEFERVTSQFLGRF